MSRSALLINATWWRCQLKVLDDCLAPLGSFDPYNVFDWYFPKETSTREERSLPYLFLDVDATNPEEIGKFCGRFGLLGDTEAEGFGAAHQRALKRVGRLPKAKSPLRRFEEEFRGPEIRNSLAGFGSHPGFLCHMPFTTFQRAQAELRETIDMIRHGENLNEDNRDKLRQRIAKKLSFGRHVPIWDPALVQWTPSWEIVNLEAAMYLMVYLDLLGQGQILGCQRCGKLFLGDHPKTLFCSTQCQNANKVKRFRQKTAERETKGGKKLQRKEQPHGEKRRKR